MESSREVVMKVKQSPSALISVSIFVAVCASLWALFYLALFRMDLIYTQSWYRLLEFEDEELVDAFIEGGLAKTCLPLIASNLLSLIALIVVARRRSQVILLVPTENEQLPSVAGQASPSEHIQLGRITDSSA
jgi:hypothetical protein